MFKPHIALFVGVAATMGGKPMAYAADRGIAELPSYKFTAGLELIYRQTLAEDLLEKTKSEEEKDHPRRETQSEWRMYPVRKNADGSWRLLIRRKYRSLSIPKEGKPEVNFENDFLGYCDLQPDGTYKKNESCGENSIFQLQPEEIFIQLPDKESALRDGWQFETATSGALYSLSARPGNGELLEITGTHTEPEDVNYELTRQYTMEFDQDRGVLAKRVTETKADWELNPGHVRQTVELVSSEPRDEAFMMAFATDADAYFKADEKFWETYDKAARARSRAACEALVEDLYAELKRLRDAAATSDAQELFDARIALFEREREGIILGAKKREELYAKAPLDWETTDFDGQPQRLVDYRDKVLVLDFWYRGCGHCIKALPKIKELAARYGDKGVVVLGVNNDSNDRNARHVIDSFDLEYRCVRNGKISEEYGVQAWPTVIVLDQTGRVALFSEGNNEKLVEEISATVDELLANPGASADSE